MRVWKVITDLTPDESEMAIDLFTQEDAERIREMDANAEIFSWDFIEGDLLIPYLLCSENIMNAICDMCDRYSISFGPIDITEEFLMGMYEIPDSDFTNYLEQNLTEDIVYAKIKKLGVNSLTDLDKRILEYSI